MHGPSHDIFRGSDVSRVLVKGGNMRKNTVKSTSFSLEDAYQTSLGVYVVGVRVQAPHTNITSIGFTSCNTCPSCLSSNHSFGQQLGLAALFAAAKKLAQNKPSTEQANAGPICKTQILVLEYAQFARSRCSDTGHPVTHAVHFAGAVGHSKFLHDGASGPGIRGMSSGLLRLSVWLHILLRCAN
jgi:hypothetical protein